MAFFINMKWLCGSTRVQEWAQRGQEMENASQPLVLNRLSSSSTLLQSSSSSTMNKTLGPYCFEFGAHKTGYEGFPNV